MKLTRQGIAFLLLVGAAGLCAAGEASSFGARRIYYNNFAEHLLNAYGPNMTYPCLPGRWTDRDWRGTMNMVADFGFNAFSFWLVPRLFAPGVTATPFGRQFIHQIEVAADAAHRRGMKVEALVSLATMGDDWLTLCPNDPADRAKIDELWRMWVTALPGVDIWHIFPGDPGACSRNGCTANTYIDVSCEVARLIRAINPRAEIAFNTWGPPFFGWGNIQGPPGWKGEFVQSYQGTAWTFDAKRMRESMAHLVAKLPEFPSNTCVAINLGFNPDGQPNGEADARDWAREIARTNPIQTWDFSLTEGENNVVPHFRFKRLFEQRRVEREAAPYQGGICFTMSPRLNVLSLYMAAQSFMNPDADWMQLARGFYEKTFGVGAGEIVDYLPYFEVVKDWGNYVDVNPTRAELHAKMTRFVQILRAWKGRTKGTLKLYPSAESHRGELEFYATLFRDLSGENPDYDALSRRYWQHVYAIWDHLPQHVDPRPRSATNALIDRFRNL